MRQANFEGLNGGLPLTVDGQILGYLTLTVNISGMPAVARNYITILLIFVDATAATVLVKS